VVSYEPPDVFGVAHCPFAWCNVVVILVPVPDLVELYPWESGVVFLAASVGFVELHPATCDSISDVPLRIVVVILELVNAELRVA
jgi:hypothetical protein